MILYGHNFGHVFQGSGATNFYGGGWWYHWLLKLASQSFANTTLVTKTTTLHPWAGNMPLKKDGITPREFFPKCIHVNRRTGAAVNAVGLSGPGIDALLMSKKWQQLTSPFVLSIMSIAKTANERHYETREMVQRIQAVRSQFQSIFAIQENFSCPNGGIDPNDLINEVIPCLETTKKSLDLPTIPKFGPTASPKALAEIASHPACDALCLTNTLPWDDLPEDERLRYFNTTISPLEKHFGPKFKGGVSGRPLKVRNLNLIGQLRSLGVKKPIIACGGILHWRDALDYADTKVQGVSVSSIAFINPLQLTPTIKFANRYFRNLEKGR